MGDPELPIKDWKGYISAGDIENISRKLQLPLQGVFSKDELPRHPQVCN